MSTYFTGKIYAIKCNETDDTYIGSTIQTLNERLIGHKKNMKRWKEGKRGYITSFEIVKYDSCYIELLETYPCDSKMELERKEGEYIRNVECVNKRIEGRTKKEYYVDNEEHIVQKSKGYYKDNKEHILQKSKGYYEANKEQILQKRKEYYVDNEEHIVQKSKGYYEANKERVSQRMSQRYTCVCGSNTRKSDRRKHERTKKHGEYINELQENADPVNLNEFFEQFKFKVSM